MRIGRVPLGILIWAIGAIILLAGVVYIELTRDITDALVLSKRERVVPDLSGTTWSQRSEALVRYQVGRRTYENWIRLDASQYDTLRRRDTVRVSYASVNPEWVRPEARSPLVSTLQVAPPWQTFTWLTLIAGLAYLAVRFFRGGIIRWWIQPRSTGRRALLVTVVLSWVMVVTSGYTPPPWQALFLPERDRQAEARIRDVRMITQVGGGYRENQDALPVGLPQGFERVELIYIPETMDDSVLAVDEVDVGTAGELRAGMSVPVIHDPDRPRSARLVAGERSHLWKNPLVFQGIVLSVTVIMLSLPLAWRWYRGG